MIFAQVKEGVDVIKGLGESTPVLAAFIVVVIAFLIFLFVLLKVVFDYLKAEREAREKADKDRSEREKERDDKFVAGMASAGAACHDVQTEQADKYERLVSQTNQVIEKNTIAHAENTHATREVRDIALRLEAKL